MIVIYSKFIPPSSNAAFRNPVATDNTKRRIKTARYRNWFQAFGYDVNLAMRSQHPIAGPYSIKITIDESTRHGLSDIMNREKCVSDALQELGVIKNDNLCQSGTVQWGEARGGIRVELEAFAQGQ